jgi:hypothetical protein
MAECCCIEIQVQDIVTSDYSIYALSSVEGGYNGRCYWTFNDGVRDFYLWWDGIDIWYLTTILGDLSVPANIVGSWKKDELCPATEGSGTAPFPNGNFFSFWLTRDCVTTCDCILFGITDPAFSVTILSSATHNNRPVYVFNLGGFTYYIFYNANSSRWEINRDSIGGLFIDDSFQKNEPCPIGLTYPLTTITIEEGNCVCEPIEERIFKDYESIKLPEIFEEEDRGWFKCCDPQLVLADPVSSDTWKNDVNSAWIKLSDPTDTATIELTKDGSPTTYPVTIVQFPEEPLAIYRTIYWQDVLISDGEGCYKIEITYNIGGMNGSFTWGIYDLKTYSIQTALTTARIRVKLNLKQEIEGINFTNSEVEDSIRFHGFIGNRQPNMEIDNLIYQDRVVRSVVRENLDTYEIKTDPYTDETIRRLTDLYLLSENEMFISDYNAFNNNYRIQDIPVVTQESPEIDYLDQFQRRAILTCIVGDRTKNKRTFY